MQVTEQVFLYVFDGDETPEDSEIIAIPVDATTP
jgi:hypothetical protein